MLLDRVSVLMAYSYKTQAPPGANRTDSKKQSRASINVDMAVCR
jgi:hypothetical protein